MEFDWYEFLFNGIKTNVNCFVHDQKKIIVTKRDQRQVSQNK